MEELETTLDEQGNISTTPSLRYLLHRRELIPSGSGEALALENDLLRKGSMPSIASPPGEKKPQMSSWFQRLFYLPVLDWA